MLVFDLFLTGMALTSISSRMVNPGVFRGSRKDFLLGEKAAYVAGVQGGYVHDALVDIQRKYLKRYPISLPHSEEPSSESLASIDDNAPDPEQEEPDKEKMEPEAYAEAMKAVEVCRSLIVYRKAVRFHLFVWLPFTNQQSTSAAN